ncbi:MAG: hypothetical protein AB7L66_06860 [Gemmatimonadales bacterium]
MIERLSEIYDTPELSFSYPASCAVAVYDWPETPSLRRVVVGLPGPDGTPGWANGQVGFGVTTAGAGGHATVAAVIAAGELHPAGSPGDLVPRQFAGFPALWRDGVGDGAWTWVYVVAHGLLRTISWSRPADEPLQRAVLESIRLGERR